MPPCLIHSLDPPPLFLARGIQHHEAGRLADAEQLYRRILQDDPPCADALHLLGVIALQRGEMDSAILQIRQAIAINPHNEAFHSNLGAAYQEASRFEEALASFRRALALKPHLAEAHNNLGNVFRAFGQLEQALDCYRQALALKPDMFEALNNLGTVCRDLGRFDEAIAAHTRALGLQPESSHLHGSLAYIARQQARLDDAVSGFQQAAALDPKSATSWMNLGCVYHDQRRLDKALDCYARAINLDPQNTHAHFNRALIWLLQNRWEEGWQEYEWRWKRKGVTSPRSYDRPVWDSGDLAGRTILVVAEQGLGDTLQFIRYCPLLRRIGARVVLEAPREFMRLLEGWPGVDLLVEEGTKLPPFDVYACILSLPRLLRTTPQAIPADVPYLTARQERVDDWRQYFSPCREFRVGITWQGNPKHDRDRYRSIPLELFLPLQDIAGVKLYSLQKDADQRQLEQLSGSGIEHLAGRLDDFEDTAAAIHGLDLLITCDTAVAHLAGTLGAPVWVAASHLPDWRWQLDRDDSPWYPTLRLFRQQEPGDWSEVFQRIHNQLRERVAAPDPR